MRQHYRREFDKKPIDWELVGETANRTLSEKALLGRVSVNQSLLCLRVANKLRAIRDCYYWETHEVAEDIRVSAKTLRDVDARSVLIPNKTLAEIEARLDERTAFYRAHPKPEGVTNCFGGLSFREGTQSVPIKG
jgi:hypothetical protein